MFRKTLAPALLLAVFALAAPVWAAEPAHPTAEQFVASALIEAVKPA